MSFSFHKSNNGRCLLYHLACPTKYRRIVVSEAVDKTMKHTCLGIEKRYDIHFLKIGTDQNRVHFVIQSILVMLQNASFKSSKALRREKSSKRTQRSKSGFGDVRFGRAAISSIRLAAKDRNPPCLSTSGTKGKRKSIRNSTQISQPSLRR